MNHAVSPTFDALDLRMRRLFRPDGRSVIVALDHAITMGPAEGLRRPRQVVEAASHGGADAVLLRPGLSSALSGLADRHVGIIMALTGRLTRGVDHVQLNQVDHAIASGADSVNGEFKFGGDGDLENVRAIAQLSEEAHRYNLPVLVTVYTLPNMVESLGISAYAHGCRIAEEIGADVIKTALPMDDEAIGLCVESVSVPIVAAGGEPQPGRTLASSLDHLLSLGVRGVAAGRQAWGTDDPVSSIRELTAVVHP